MVHSFGRKKEPVERKKKGVRCNVEAANAKKALEVDDLKK